MRQKSGLRCTLPLRVAARRQATSPTPTLGVGRQRTPKAPLPSLKVTPRAVQALRIAV
jgi:hypothetical protein